MKIQKIAVTNSFLGILFLSLFFTSCKDNEGQPEPGSNLEEVQETVELEVLTIQETLNGVTELSHFAMVLGAYQFPDSISNDQPITVFAPTNDIFPPYDGTGENKENNYTFEGELISYYIVGDSFNINELREMAENDSTSYINSLNGERINLKLDGETLSLEGNFGQSSKIIRSVEASNGIIHVINNNLLPIPTANQLE